jgi:hypothetical protein
MSAWPTHILPPAASKKRSPQRAWRPRRTRVSSFPLSCTLPRWAVSTAAKTPRPWYSGCSSCSPASPSPPGETTGRSPEGSVTAGTGRDYRSGSSAGAAGRRDRLGVSRSALCQCLHAGSGPARPADPAGGGAVHSNTCTTCRVLCARWLENPLLPILLRRAELLPQAAVRPFVTDALAPAAGRGAAGGVDPGELSVAHKTGALSTGVSNGWWSTLRCSPRRSPIPPMRGYATAPWKNWSIWRDATMCHYGRATGASPSVRRSWSGATHMPTSSSGPGASSGFCAFGSAA